MFGDHQQAYVEFPSSWSKRRQLAESSSQTHDVQSEDATSQTAKSKSVKVQTQAEDSSELVLLKDDSPQLLQFLRRVEPIVCKALEKNTRSHAFDGYRLQSEDAVSTISVTHTLYNAELEQTMQVTGLSWNCIGSVIAASYGRLDHEDWCTHRACLTTWNLDRTSLKADKPDMVIDQSSCVMCLTYHPTQPPLLAAANFNGEVLVYDMSQPEEPLVATSGIGDDSHREPVNKIEWIPHTDTRKYQLMTVSGDGKVLVWALKLKSRSVQLVRGFMTLSESLPLSLKSRSSRADKEIGLTCVSYNADDPDTFIVGSESGAVFKCSQTATGTPAPSNVVSSVPLHSPVTLTYTPHHGPVSSLHMSPFHRNVFVTCALDQTLHIYNTLQAQPVMVISPGHGYLHSVQWSPSHPTVAATTTDSGHLLMYDLSQGKTTAVQTLQVTTQSSPLHSLQFNKKRPNQLAVGDSLGYIHIVRLNDELVSGSVTRDLHTLSTLTSVKVDE